MSEEIQAGDLVQLKSGGPVMTVSTVHVDEEQQKYTYCAWFVDGWNYHCEHFTVPSLKKVVQQVQQTGDIDF